MQDSLATYLCSSPFLRVLRCLYYYKKPVHLRELVRSHGISPGGVSDILRRLGAMDLVTMTKEGNRKYYELNTSAEEDAILDALFKAYERSYVTNRKLQLERDAHEKLLWMDETYEFFKDAKQKNAHSS